MAELIVALDLPGRTQALAVVDSVKDIISWVKVGMELFTRCGPSLVSELKDRGLRVFLDLKFYDIPNTVERAVYSAQEIGVDLLTLHCQGGKRMLAAAVEAKATVKTPPLLFGVTALTSFAPNEMPGINKNPGDFALDLAQLAAEARLDGVVCSVHELSAIRSVCPNLLCLCPGIRPEKTTARHREDQKRVATPGEAVRLGASYLVVGRPVLLAEHPRQMAQEILEEMAQAETRAED